MSVIIEDNTSGTGYCIMVEEYMGHTGRKYYHVDSNLPLDTAYTQETQINVMNARLQHLQLFCDLILVINLSTIIVFLCTF